MGAIFITREKSLSAKGLRLLFKGEERVRVIDKETKRSCDEDFLFHEYAQEVKEVINRGKIKSGKYIVPFKIRIPDELPQTVTIPWTHVSYIVACELEDREGHKEELASSRVNILAKPILHEPSPFRREPFVEFVRKNRFLSGYFAITMEISDTTVEPGEEVAVSVAIRNRSPLKILKVKALLKEEVFSRAAQNERVADKVLAFHEFKVYRATGRKRSKWLRGSDPMEDCDEIEVELEYEEHQGTLRIPKVGFTSTICEKTTTLVQLISQSLMHRIPHLPTQENYWMSSRLCTLRSRQSLMIRLTFILYPLA